MYDKYATNSVGFSFASFIQILRFYTFLNERVRHQNIADFRLSARIGFAVKSRYAPWIESRAFMNWHIRVVVVENFKSFPWIWTKIWCRALTYTPVGEIHESPVKAPLCKGGWHIVTGGLLILALCQFGRFMKRPYANSDTSPYINQIQKHTNVYIWKRMKTE